MSAPPELSSPQLVRALGRWSMVALAVNCVLGSGIFGLPAPMAGLVGGASPLAVLAGGAAMAVIIACYAEVASQFTETGGTYLYVRHAFGRLIGLQVGWMTLLVRLAACGASVDLLVAYLGELWPAATQPVPRLAVISLLVGALTTVNYRGVGGGALLSNTAVAAKLTALGVVCVAGAAYLGVHPPHAPPSSVAGADGWLQALLLMFFAYGGYEAALNPAGEARDPRRDIAFALFVALILVTALYTTLQWIVIAVLTDPAHSERPLADAARVLLGARGAAFISIGALISVYGYLSANLLAVPRALYALAERGDFPPVFATVHARLRTPHVSIVVFAAFVWVSALFGSFSWNVTLSAVARLSYYAAVCAAVPVLRRRQPAADALRVPGGWLLPVLGVTICAVLVTRVDFTKSVILLATVGVALANWAAVRGGR